uniref:Large ribosomal subunit protein uL24c n=1 Tax=Inkyuleea mariana TaxID=123988 RepID=A0A4D6X023_9FLOR|nr:ribosomal protein L24 [Inkyuleea mariana]
MKIKKQKMHIKKGDIVKIISGKHKGEIGEIIKILYKNHKIIIQNINIKTKHLRAKKEEETGKIIKLEGPIDSSNVILSKINTT